MPSTSITYATDNLIEALVLSTLPDFGEHGDGILNSNMLTGYLNQKKAKEVIDGALEFWAGITKAENSNAKWQGKNDDMSANSQDPKNRLRFPIKVFTDTIVLNDLDKAMNKGKAAIKSFVKDLQEQADSTIKNSFNSAWWNTSPGSDEPDSVPSMISATPTTGNVGGLARSGNDYLQNGLYSTNISDIGSENGIADIFKLRIKYSVGTSMADLIMMAEDKFANLAGYLTTLRRYQGSAMMAQIGIESIQLGTATIGYENTNVLGGHNAITSGYMYGINTKFFKIKTLKDGNAKWGTAFERIGKSLNKMLPFYFFGNLWTNNPRAHWVATDLS